MVHFSLSHYSPRVRARVEGSFTGKRLIFFTIMSSFFEPWRRIRGIPRGKGDILGWIPGWQSRTPSSSFSLSSHDSPLFLSSSALPPFLATFLFPSFFFSLLFHLPLPNFGPGHRGLISYSLSIVSRSRSLILNKTNPFITLNTLSLFTHPTEATPTHVTPTVDLAQNLPTTINFTGYRVP